MRNGQIAAAGLAACLTTSLAMAIGGATGAAAQVYPERVVQIIAPATAGSSADILGRVLADGFSARFGKPFIIVNKPGANGVLGTADVARASPDGYTLLHTATYSITVQPLTNKEVGYTAKSFTPICQTFKNDQVVIVPPNSPLKTAHDLVEAAKKKPGRGDCRHSRYCHHSASRHDPIGGRGQSPIQRRAVQGTGRGNSKRPLRTDRLRRGAADRRGGQRACRCPDYSPRRAIPRCPTCRRSRNRATTWRR